jgi:hypothetical protein
MVYFQSNASIIESRTDTWNVSTPDWSAELDPLILVGKVLVDTHLPGISSLREGAVDIIVDSW